MLQVRSFGPLPTWSRGARVEVARMSTLSRAGLGPLPVLVDVVVRKNNAESYVSQELRVAGKRNEAVLGFRGSEGWDLHRRDKALLSSSSVGTLFLCHPNSMVLPHSSLRTATATLLLAVQVRGPVTTICTCV